MTSRRRSSPPPEVTGQSQNDRSSMNEFVNHSTVSSSLFAYIYFIALFSSFKFNFQNNHFFLSEKGPAHQSALRSRVRQIIGNLGGVSEIHIQTANGVSGAPSGCAAVTPNEGFRYSARSRKKDYAGTNIKSYKHYQISPNVFSYLFLDL